MEENFLKWTKDVTKGSTFSLQKVTLTKDHLASLLKVKGFDPVLVQLVRHARPQSERQHMRLNLKHAALKKQLEEKGTTGAQNRLASLGSSVEDERRKVAAEAQELKKLVEEESRLMFEEEEVKRQLALIDVASRKKQVKTERMHEWTSTVQQLLPNLPPPESPQLESIRQVAANEDLQVSLDKLKDLKRRLLGNKEFHDDKVEVWSLVESLIARHSPRAVMQCLVSCAMRETVALEEETAKIDLNSDAKSLRLKYKSSGELVDDLSPRGVLDSIESMLVEMSGKHIKSHFSVQKRMTEAKSTVQAASNIMDSVHAIAKEVYISPALVSSVMTLCEERLQLAGLKGSLGAASALVGGLAGRGGAAKRANEAMLNKYTNIHRFEEKVKSEVSELKSLVLCASQSRDELESEKEGIRAAVDEGVGGIVLPTPVIKGGFSGEVDALLDVPFESLKSLENENGVVPCLPRGPMESSSNSYLKGLSWAVPFVASYDCLLEVTRQRKQKLRQCQDFAAVELSSFDAMAALLEKQSLSTYKVKDLCREVETHDRSLEAQVLPVVSQCEEIQTDTEHKLELFKEALSEWWTQPGPLVKEYMKQKESVNNIF